jgi:hypothetical protein
MGVMVGGCIATRMLSLRCLSAALCYYWALWHMSPVLGTGTQSDTNVVSNCLLFLKWLDRK